MKRTQDMLLYVGWFCRDFKGQGEDLFMLHIITIKKINILSRVRIEDYHHL